MGGRLVLTRIRLMKRRILPLAGTLALAAVLAFAVAGFGQDDTADRQPIMVAELGPQVGELVPDFEMVDQFGNTHDLESIMGPNGAMLLFHRSADW